MDLQKASMWKRISAFLFDGILLSIMAVLFAWLLSVLLGFDGYYQTVTDGYDRYAQEYGVDFSMTTETYESLTAQERENVEAAYAALSADEETAYAYRMVMQLSILITSLGLLAGFLSMEFAVPLLLGNGQTLGKKIFGIGLMRTDGVKVGPISLFIRTLLGKYTLETMIPVYILLMIFWGTIGIVGPVVIGLIWLTELILLCATQTRSLLHDLLAGTVAVDVASQRIFDTREDMIAYYQRQHAEKVSRQTRSIKTSQKGRGLYESCFAEPDQDFPQPEQKVPRDGRGGQRLFLHHPGRQAHWPARPLRMREKHHAVHD